MKRSFTRARRAFTLIELLMVCVGMTIFVSAAVGLESKIREAGLRVDARLSADADARGALDRWRADVALATRCELADAGRTLIIRTVGAADPAPPETIIRYSLDADGSLTRRAGQGTNAAPGPREVLARGVREASFAPVGHGWRVRWNVPFDDGAIKLNWSFSGVAAPLLPLEAGS